MKVLKVLLIAALALTALRAYDHLKTPSVKDFLRYLHRQTPCQHITVFIDEDEGGLKIYYKCKEEKGITLLKTSERRLQ